MPPGTSRNVESITLGQQLLHPARQVERKAVRAQGNHVATHKHADWVRVATNSRMSARSVPPFSISRSQPTRFAISFSSLPEPTSSGAGPWKTLLISALAVQPVIKVVRGCSHQAIITQLSIPSPGTLGFLRRSL